MDFEPASNPAGCRAQKRCKCLGPKFIDQIGLVFVALSLVGLFYSIGTSSTAFFSTVFAATLRRQFAARAASQHVKRTATTLSSILRRCAPHPLAMPEPSGCNGHLAGAVPVALFLSAASMQWEQPRERSLRRGAGAPPATAYWAVAGPLLRVYEGV